jgi:hypothetical protein
LLAPLLTVSAAPLTACVRPLPLRPPTVPESVYVCVLPPEPDEPEELPEPPLVESLLPQPLNISARQTAMRVEVLGSRADRSCSMSLPWGTGHKISADLGDLLG